MSGGALAVLVLAIWSMWPSSPAPSASAAAPAARGAQQSRTQPAGVVEVKLDALTAERQQPSDTPRNPFRYQPKAPPPPPRPVAPPPTNASAEPAKPLPPPGPPPPAPIALKFIGIVTRANGVEWAVLTDGKSLPMHGREGDIIDGRYRIVEIGTESIVLTYVDGRGRQVVRLTGQ